MKSTRCLFVITGTTSSVRTVIDSLQFKGLMVFPPGEIVTAANMEQAYSQNKCVACSITSLKNNVPDEAVIVTTIDSEPTNPGILSTIDIICTVNNDIAKQFAKIAIRHNIDIGDHKSNTSGQADGGPTISDCAYCKYLKGERTENERRVYESQNFFVMPTVGQFACGYLLIIPKAHVMSNAELPPDVMQEFEEVLADIEYILTATYKKDVLVWENGSGHSGASKAKDSIVHSHVHIVPSYTKSDDIEEMSQFPFEEVTLQTLCEHYEHPYLLIRTPSRRKWIIADSSNLYVPRQYVRQIVAEEYGYIDELEFWNWRKYPFRDKMNETIQDISWYLRVHWDSLPERIKNNTRRFL